MVKSGAYFPAYVQELNKVGVKKYDTYVSEGHTLFNEGNNYQLKTLPACTASNVTDTDNVARITHYLKIQKQGETDYTTFCNYVSSSPGQLNKVSFGDLKSPFRGLGG